MYFPFIFLTTLQNINDFVYLHKDIVYNRNKDNACIHTKLYGDSKNMFITAKRFTLRHVFNAD